MHEAAERLAAATDAAGIGEALADAAARRVGFGSFSFVPFQPGLVSSWDIVVRSSEFPTKAMKECCLGSITAIERELGGLAATFEHPGPKSFDIAQRFRPAEVERLDVFQSYWRPYKLERQLVASMHGGGAPLGFVCLARARGERPFTAADLALVEQLRSLAEAAVAGLRWVGSADLTAALAALGRAFEGPAFLLDGHGRLQWMSDDGAVRLGVEAARAGAATILRGSGALEVLSRAAIGWARDPTAHPEALLRSARVLGPEERVVARRFDDPKRLVLLAFEPDRSAVGGRVHPARLPRMGAVELRVARLAAGGHAVLNIASRLGVAETTVRTHLRRVYSKLGVHTRAELACALFAAGSDPQPR